MKFSTQYLSQQIIGARYYCPKNIACTSPLQIICAGRESCRPDYQVKRKNFPWNAIELVTKGEGWLTLNKRRLRLRPGILFRYNQETCYEMISDAAQPLEKYFVDFSGSEVQRLLSKLSLKAGQARQVLFPYEMQELFDRILLEGNRKTKLSAPIAENYLRLLLQKIDQCVDIGLGACPSRAMSSYLRSKDFLDKNFTQNFTMEQVAEQLGMRPETLCRLFQRFSQATPYQYLVRLRINLSVDLLMGTDLLTKQIAQEVGFPDPFHFSRIFKRLQGVSPETFRRLQRK